MTMNECVLCVPEKTKNLFGLDDVSGIIQLYLSFIPWFSTVPAFDFDLGDKGSMKGFKTKLKSPPTIQHHLRLCPLVFPFLEPVLTASTVRILFLSM